MTRNRPFDIHIQYCRPAMAAHSGVSHASAATEPRWSSSPQRHFQDASDITQMAFAIPHATVATKALNVGLDSVGSFVRLSNSRPNMYRPGLMASGIQGFAGRARSTTQLLIGVARAPFERSLSRNISLREPRNLAVTDRSRIQLPMLFRKSN